MTGDPERDFDGAKTILLLGGQLAVIRRDNIDGIAYPGCLDLPGGGREGGESPEACALREMEEELGLRLSSLDLTWRRFYTVPSRAWFFAAALAVSSILNAVYFFRVIEQLYLRTPVVGAAPIEAPGVFRIPAMILAVLVLALGLSNQALVDAVIFFALPGAAG